MPSAPKRVAVVCIKILAIAVALNVFGLAQGLLAIGGVPKPLLSGDPIRMLNCAFAVAGYGIGQWVPALLVCVIARLASIRRGRRIAMGIAVAMALLIGFFAKTGYVAMAGHDPKTLPHLLFVLVHACVYAGLTLGLWVVSGLIWRAGKAKPPMLAETRQVGAP